MTESNLQRIYVYISSADQWYSVMKECRSWFGKNWRTQGRVKRKFDHSHIRTMRDPIPVWFEVPDQRFATWISVKHSLQVAREDKFKTAK
jgi:uncharacterized protein (DUF924 family)